MDQVFFGLERKRPLEVIADEMIISRGSTEFSRVLLLLLKCLEFCTLLFHPIWLVRDVMDR